MTAFARTLIDDPDSATVRTTLGAQAALGYNPVQQGTGVGQGPNVVKLGWTAAGLKVTIDSTDVGVLWMDFNSVKSVSGQGYVKLNNGVIIQWGNNFNVETDFAQNFHLAFPSFCLGVQLTASVNAPTTSFYGVDTSNVSTSSFDIRARLIANGGSVSGQGSLPVYWLAYGF